MSFSFFTVLSRFSAARPLVWLCLLASLWVGAGSTWAAASNALKPCRQPGIPNEVLCGQLMRPLNPQDAHSQLIEIHYVVLPALSRQKYSDPIFFLAGGPGQSAIDLAPQLAALWGRRNTRRDVVLVDQRGTGRSAPLFCEEPGRSAMADQSLGPQVARLMTCRDELAKLPYVQGLSGLRWFTTSLAVQDLDAVRQQLGAPRVNLVGGSYGTRVALEWLRQFPDTVRRVVLDGVAPPDMALPDSSAQDARAALEALLTACEKEAACAKKYPSLRTDWERLWHSMPQRVTVAHPVDGQRETFTLTPDLLAAWVRGPLYVPSLASALPAALTQAVAGRWESLVGLSAVLSARQGADQVAMGMHFSVVCAEDQPLVLRTAEPSGAEDWNRGAGELYAQVCAKWPAGDVPASFKQVPASRSAVLILSGGLDPITPPRHGQRMAEALGPMARHVVVPQAGHGLMGLGCLADVLMRFINEADDRAALALNTACAEKIPRPLMFQPVEVPR